MINFPIVALLNHLIRIVYKGKYKGREVAIKQMRKSFDRKELTSADNETIREISILQ